MVPTSRQYEGDSGVMRTQDIENGCASAWPSRTARGITSRPKSWAESGSSWSSSSSRYRYSAVKM